jgi:hypothetical protein
MIGYIQIHTNTYIYIHTGYSEIPMCGNILKDTNRLLLIHTDTCKFLLQKKYPHILSYTYNTYQIPKILYLQIVG